MTIEQARKLIQCFGPCTVLFECRSPADLVEDETDLRKAAEGYLTVEEREWDDAVDAACHQEASGEDVFKGKHQRIINERNVFLGKLRERVNALLKEEGLDALSD